MIFVVLGGPLSLVGLVIAKDMRGIGTKWREVSMRSYDRSLGPDAYDKNPRRFQLYYRAGMIFGLVVFVCGLLILA